MSIDPRKCFRCGEGPSASVHHDGEHVDFHGFVKVRTLPPVPRDRSGLWTFLGIGVVIFAAIAAAVRLFG